MRLYQYLPFFHKRIGDTGFTLDTKSIIQSLITAAVTGAFVIYGTQKMLSAEVSTMRDQISEIKRDIGEIRRDFYVPINKRSGM